MSEKLYTIKEGKLLGVTTFIFKDGVGREDSMRRTRRMRRYVDGDNISKQPASLVV